MQADVTVLLRKDRYAILSKSQTLSLRDGTTVRLHLVQVDGESEPSRFLRSIAHDVAGTFIFNVADLVTDLDLEIRQLPERDTMGLISYSLRQRFTTAHTLRVAVVENCLKSFREVPSDTRAEEHEYEWGTLTAVEASDVSRLTQYITSLPDQYRAPFDKAFGAQR